jgi:hypothetical protein
MKLSGKSKFRLIILLTIIYVIIFVGGIVRDISFLIQYVGEHPSPSTTSIFIKVIDRFWLEFLTIGAILFYTKIFLDKLTNEYIKHKRCSISQLIEKGNFKKNYFKIKDNEVITKFYKQRKVIRFLKNL